MSLSCFVNAQALHYLTALVLSGIHRHHINESKELKLWLTSVGTK